jgi:nucleoside 2-deoxyribosyltransferase
MPENWPSDLTERFKQEIKGVDVNVCTSGTSGDMITCRTFIKEGSIAPAIYFVIDVNELQQGKTIYIAGPISNMPDDNYAAFEQAEILLRTLNFQPVNPHKVYHEADELKRKATTESQRQEINKKYWADYLKKDLQEAMECDCVFLLPGWENSRGATLECFVLSILGKEVYILENDSIKKVEILIKLDIAIK